MADVCHTHEYLVADDLPLAVGIGVEDGEAAAGVSEDQFGPWESKEGGHHLLGRRESKLTDRLAAPSPFSKRQHDEVPQRFPINQMSPLQVTHNPSLFVTKAVIL